MSPRRLHVAIVATHPVQYYAPWYRALAGAVDLRVFYGHRQSPADHAKSGFGVTFQWDRPLLSGYEHRFLSNRARAPDVSTFFGCSTPELPEILRRERFDAVIVHGWAVQMYWQAMAACWRMGTPVLVRGDSQLDAPRSALWRTLKYPLYRAFIPRFAAYLVVGSAARKYYEHYGADPRRMFFVPHAVDNDYFGQQARSLRPHRDVIRDGWGVGPREFVCLFVGKLLPGKRAETLIRAVSLGRSRGRPVTGLIVGDGPERPRLEQLVRELRAPVRFAGFLNQSAMPRAYAAADVLVVPSASETWGLVVNEAMASGLPALLSTSVGCWRDLVVPGRTGDVFATGDTRRLAQLIEALAGTPENARALGQCAAEHVGRYSIAAATSGTIEALHWVVDGHQPSGQATVRRKTTSPASLPR